MSRDHMFTEGDRVDRYVIERLLGEGGSAQVWQVRHQLLGTPYALKVLRSPDRTVQQQLLREGRAQATLNHPAILPVRDAFWARGHMALLMPLVEGPSLRQVLAQGRVPVHEALSVMAALLGGLTAIHDKGLVHCDLKPENILLDLQEEAIVPRMVDFGLVSPVGGGVTRGTPAYVAPELLSGSVAGPRSDLFSIGAVFYELLAGQRAFPIETLEEARVRSLPDLRAVPTALRRMLSSLMATDPAGRPAESRAVQEALASVGPLPLDGEIARRVTALRLPAVQHVVPRTVDQTHAVPHNLPSYDSTLVGRRPALAALAARLEQGARLLSIVGIGGIGKTRLAVAFAQQQRRAFGGGVWLCSLRDAGDEGEIAAALGQTLGASADTSIAQLCDILNARGATMLVLDGLEDVRPLCCAVLTRTLAAAPQLIVVATTRQALGLPHESCVALGPLPFGDAIALFSARAVVQLPLSDVRRMVIQLDRIPLAVELAASRAALPPVELLEQLHDDPRLRAVLRWSWETLSAPARDVLAQLSVLDGSFSLSIAAPLVALAPGTGLRALLDELRVAGLVHRSDEGGSPRMETLHTARRFAGERLAPDALDGVMRRLAEMCARLLPADALRERSLVRLAARWGMHNLSGEQAVSLVRRAHRTLMISGELDDAARLLARADAAQGTLSPALSASLLLCHAWTDREAGRMAASAAVVERARVLFTSIGDDSGLRDVARARAALYRKLGLYDEANQILRRLLANSDAYDDFAALADGLRVVGEFAEARALLTRAIASEQKDPIQLALFWARMELDMGQLAACSDRLEAVLQDPLIRGADVVSASLLLAEACLLGGQLEEAERHVARARGLGEQGSLALLVWMESVAGALLAARGALQLALDALQRALRDSVRARNEVVQAVVRCDLAQVLSELGRHDDAIAQASSSLALARRQPTAFLPLIGGRVAVIMARAGALDMAERALAVPGPQTPQARIAIQAAHACIATVRGDVAAVELLTSARAALLRAGFAQQSAIGRLLQEPAPVQDAASTYCHTLPRDQATGA